MLISSRRGSADKPGLIPSSRTASGWASATRPGRATGQLRRRPQFVRSTLTRRAMPDTLSVGVTLTYVRGEPANRPPPQWYIRLALSGGTGKPPTPWGQSSDRAYRFAGRFTS